MNKWAGVRHRALDDLYVKKIFAALVHEGIECDT